MYYTVYKITNQISGKVYIGSHKTKNLDDGYMGSGKYLKRAIEKNGVENFSKEILFVFDTPEEMYAKEAELVNEEFLAEANTYNLKVGGCGGFDYINKNFLQFGGIQDQKIFSSRGIAKQKFLYENDLEWARKKDERTKALIILGVAANRKKTQGNFHGMKHTEDSRRKIGEKNSKAQAGSNNSQYGSMWIYNETTNESKKIAAGCEVPDGWKKGRKIKKFKEC